MDTTTTLQAQQNFSEFWQGQMPPSAAISSAVMPSSFFYNISPAQRQSTTQSTTTLQQQLQQSPANSMGCAAASSTDPALAFQSAMQQQNRPFALFGSDRGGIQHQNFRPNSPIGAVAHFQPGAAGHFPPNFPSGLLHPTASGTHMPFPSAVASVSFDCMGLMNFGQLNSTAAIAGQSSKFAMPQMTIAGNSTATAAALQPSSAAALMPMMSAIYANGGAGIPRTSNFLQNSATVARPSPSPLALRQSSSSNLTLGENNNNQQQQQSTQLFDLSNQVANSNAGSVASVLAAAVSSAVGIGSGLSQNHQQIAANANRPATQQQQSSLAFGLHSFTGAKTAEIAKIPKETATIPLESRDGISSTGGSSNEQRAQQTQMSCQVCHLAASNGLHFGARTCAACAAFFRRSISDQKRYICKRSQRCVIKPNESGAQGYRKMCRNCRMRRCLEIGMLPENVQNKRNKREYYFVDTLNNALQQNGASAGTAMTQQQQMQDQQQQQQGTMMSKSLDKYELGKLLTHDHASRNGNEAENTQQQQSLSHMAIEKFQSKEKESPRTADDGDGKVGQHGRQSNPPVAQQHYNLLSPILMKNMNPLSATLADYCGHGQQQSASVGGGESGKNSGNEGGPVYSTPTSTTNQQQQSTQPTIGTPFSWGLANATTLREI